MNVDGVVHKDRWQAARCLSSRMAWFCGSTEQCWSTEGIFIHAVLLATWKNGR